MLSIIVSAVRKGRTDTWSTGLHLSWQVGQWASYTVSDGTGATEAVTYCISDHFEAENGRRFLLKIIQDDGVRRRELDILLPEERRKSVFEVIADDKMCLHFPQFCDRFGNVEVEESQRNGAVSVERIRLSSGEFLCHRYTFENESGEVVRVWISEEVPVLGLVRWEDAEGEMVLQAYGDEGVSTWAVKQEDAPADGKADR